MPRSQELKERLIVTVLLGQQVAGFVVHHPVAVDHFQSITINIVAVPTGAVGTHLSLVKMYKLLAKSLKTC